MLWSAAHCQRCHAAPPWMSRCQRRGPVKRGIGDSPPPTCGRHPAADTAATPNRPRRGARPHLPGRQGQHRGRLPFVNRLRHRGRVWLSSGSARPRPRRAHKPLPASSPTPAHPKRRDRRHQGGVGRLQSPSQEAGGEAPATAVWRWSGCAPSDSARDRNVPVVAEAGELRLWRHWPLVAPSTLCSPTVLTRSHPICSHPSPLTTETGRPLPHPPPRSHYHRCKCQ